MDNNNSNKEKTNKSNGATIPASTPTPYNSPATGAKPVIIKPPKSTEQKAPIADDSFQLSDSDSELDVSPPTTPETPPSPSLTIDNNQAEEKPTPDSPSAISNGSFHSINLDSPRDPERRSTPPDRRRNKHCLIM